MNTVISRRVAWPYAYSHRSTNHNACSDERHAEAD